MLYDPTTSGYYKLYAGNGSDTPYLTSIMHDQENDLVTTDVTTFLQYMDTNPLQLISGAKFSFTVRYSAEDSPNLPRVLD